MLCRVVENEMTSFINKGFQYLLSHLADNVSTSCDSHYYSIGLNYFHSSLQNNRISAHVIESVLAISEVSSMKVRGTTPVCTSCHGQLVLYSGEAFAGASSHLSSGGEGLLETGQRQDELAAAVNWVIGCELDWGVWRWTPANNEGERPVTAMSVVILTHLTAQFVNSGLKHTNHQARMAALKLTVDIFKHVSVVLKCPASVVFSLLSSMAAPLSLCSQWHMKRLWPLRTLCGETCLTSSIN